MQQILETVPDICLTGEFSRISIKQIRQEIFIIKNKKVVQAVVKIIDNRVEEDRDTTIDEILPIVKAPDFPTGGLILGTRGCEEAYRTGRGKIRVRAVTKIEALPNGKSQIIATELPYMVNKANLIIKIAELVKLKKIDGITDIRDESNREGVRV